jgi:sister-chromatid-cohesion protein PDS5
MLLRRSSLKFLNQSSIPALVKRVQKGGGKATQAATNAQILLSFTSKHCPVLYKTHISELTKAIADEKNPRLVETCLQALSSMAKLDGRVAPSDKSGHHFSAWLIFTDRSNAFLYQAGQRTDYAIRP